MKRLEDLLAFIKKSKGSGKSLSLLFEEYALKEKMNKYSVRNLYYSGLNKLEQTNESEKIFKRKKLVRFSNEERDELVETILENKLKGISVRKTCKMLSNGDEKLCIRYINKYRLEMKNKNYENDNVVTFVPKPLLNDNDIDSLFSGLVKLIKENAVKQAGVSASEVKQIKQGLMRANDEILSLRNKLRKEKDKNENLLNKLNDNFEKMKWFSLVK